MLPVTPLATIPPPPFHNLQVGPLTLHLYGLVIGVAIIAALTMAELVVGWLGGPRDRFMSAAIPAVIGGFVGARLYHVFSEPVHYAHHPALIVAVWNGGLGIYGAVIGGYVVARWSVARSGIPFGRFMDGAAVGLPLAQAIGRWGNYLNQELFGRPTSLPWGLRVDERYRPLRYIGDCCFHPTFLYESIGCLVLFGLLATWVYRTRASCSRIEGTAFPAYLAGYSLLRVFTEAMRSDQAHHFGGLRQNEWVALGLLAFALAWWAWLVRRGGPRAGEAARDVAQRPAAPAR